jgi:tetratricopeptide (TPR) repeat protein
VAIDREKVLVAAQKYAEKKKYDKAVQEYQKLIQEDPNDARILLKVGDLQSKMEAFADAVQTYERVGKFYAQQGFALKAIAVYKQIREIIAKHVPQYDERYAHITPKLAELYQQLGLTSDALAALDEVATRLQRQTRDQEAIEVFRKIVELDPTNPLPHLRLAEALSRVKDNDGAVLEFAIAGSQLVKLGRRDDALKVFERLLHHKQDPAHARIAAELYLARGQPNDGLQALSKLQICFQANPKDLDTLALLARSFNAIGQAAKGVEVQKEMARIAREQGKQELFKQIVDKLSRLAPNDEGVRALMFASMAPPSAAATSSEPPLPDSAPPHTAPVPLVSRQQPPALPTEPIEDAEGSYQSVEDAELEAAEDEQPFEIKTTNQGQPFGVVDEPTGDVVVEASVAEAPADDDAATEAARMQLARIMADAASFRRARFYAKAIDTLRRGIDIVPRSIEVREVLRDVLVEAGREPEALAEMLNIASLQIDALDGEGAAHTLQSILAVEPDNARAIEMLTALGYELVDEAPTGQPEPIPPMRGQYASYDPEAPLPSYDLEEIGPEQVAKAYSEPSVRAGDAIPAPIPRIDDMDDPFGGSGHTVSLDDAPLPSFPLDAPPDSEATFDLVGRSAGDTGEDHVAPTGYEPSGPTDAGTAPLLAPPTSSGGGHGPELEEALEEADFFASRGLYEDARTILQEQLGRLPNHPLLLERLDELQAQEGGGQVGSGTREMPRGAPVDRAFDIAETLGALEGGDRTSGVGMPSYSSQNQVDVEEVFAKFKEGVAKQIPVDDAQSHYDLGVAYKEMGLVEDSVREFELAARDPKRECICQSMIGMIHIERGNLNEAIEAFLRGLDAQMRTPEQETVLSFEVGAAYEAKKMAKEALGYFQRVMKRDPGFRDVQERVRRLSKGETKPPVRAAAVGADDEFDRAFDDIIGKS